MPEDFRFCTKLLRDISHEGDLREQVQASATPDAVPVVFPGDPVPESGPYIAIQVVDSRVRDDDESE